jgi:hypothetical protein
MTLKEVLHRRDDALMEILDRLKGKKLYNNLLVQLKFFWQESKREIYCATPWKDAQGDDLPEIDMEVIAILDNGKVAFAHRPNPDGWDAKSIITEKVERYIPKAYGKGGWNIPDVKYWLDVRLPKEIEQ